MVTFTPRELTTLAIFATTEPANKELYLPHRVAVALGLILDTEPIQVIMSASEFAALAILALYKTNEIPYRPDGSTYV